MTTITPTLRFSQHIPIPPQPPPTKTRTERALFGAAKLALFALAVVLTTLGLQNVIQLNKIPSSSMEPTLTVNEWAVMVKDLPILGLNEFSKNEVIIFVAPESWNQPYGRLVKRVVATEGDQVVCQDHQLSVNGVLDDRGCGNRNYDITVRPGEAWLLGDNRAESLDSGAFGSGVPVESIEGRVVFSFLLLP